jgi:hypothetical protein
MSSEYINQGNQSNSRTYFYNSKKSNQEREKHFNIQKINPILKKVTPHLQNMKKKIN